MKNCFKSGPIPASFIADSIEKHQVKTAIGAHEIFLGQVRADEIDDSVVIGIDYEAHEEMANTEFDAIREEAFRKFDITCLHIHHSLGFVKSGEICLFVFVSSKHRLEARKALEFLVESIKEKVPIFGKELLSDDSHTWKENK